MANKKQAHRQYQSGNPAKRAAGVQQRRQQVAATTPSSARSWINRISAPALIFMNSLPRYVVPVVMGLLLVGGLFVPAPIGAFLLALVALFIGWLFALSWPVLSPGGRLARGLVFVALLGMVWMKAAGKL